MSRLFDAALSKRLERAEGEACAEFAAARQRIFPQSGAEWIASGGTYAVFDGIDSPVTQTFGLGLFEELTATSLEAVEGFFLDRQAPVFHEVSPFAGVAAMDLLCRRGYRPVEISNVLVRPLADVDQEANPDSGGMSKLQVRVIHPEESRLWSDINAKGWSHEHPELHGFLLEMGTIGVERRHSDCFLAELNGVPGAAAGLCIHGGVALLAGSATVPELRRRGLHTALLYERLRHAARNGCDLAMIVVQPGSDSQRNAERNDFRIAYTRTKWKLYR
ncbi:MAG TPA: GNAT family N-acetyltransferase [Terriglobales bacterium]|nr:GNAT family N-acetyltransferase [Terriglobales bacterium]